MFIFDFVAETVLDQIIDWLYGKIVGFLNDFFAMMNNMGVAVAIVIPMMIVVTAILAVIPTMTAVTVILIAIREMLLYLHAKSGERL